MMKRVGLLCVCALAALPSSAFAQTGFVNMVDHIHLAAPDQEQAAAWYHKYLGGETTPEGTERLMFGTTRMIFQKNATPKPSEGSVLDLLGFSVANLDATVRQLQADGVKIVMPPMAMQGVRTAQVMDPSGTLIDLFQDPQKTGLHYICILTSNPAGTLAWFADKFGGKVDNYKGQVDGINYGGIWLLTKKGDAVVPSTGHAIDHIGFRPVNVDEAVVALKAKNVKVLTEPRPLTLPGGTMMRLAFVEGPEGVRIEMVQRDNVK